MFFRRQIRYVNYPVINESNRTNIVGQQYYQENLRDASRWPLRDDQYNWVVLRAEPENPHDRHAVRVDLINLDGSGWLTAGYISRDETHRWHPVIATAAKGSAWVWPAVLTGGHGRKYYGLYFLG